MIMIFWAGIVSLPTRLVGVGSSAENPVPSNWIAAGRAMIPPRRRLVDAGLMCTAQTLGQRLTALTISWFFAGDRQGVEIVDDGEEYWTCLIRCRRRLLSMATPCVKRQRQSLDPAVW